MENVSVPVLTVSRLSKNYGRKTALRDFSYTFTPGIYGLLGPNGAGKSTLMGILSSALRPTRGTVQYGGRDIFALGPAYRAVLGVVPQQMPLYDFFTGQEYLEYIAALKGLARKQAAADARRALASVELTEQGGARIGSYSGGMKRRLLLAQALLGDPAVLILDEPTAGLDPRGRDTITQMLLDYRNNTGSTVVIVSHSMDDVAQFADRVIVMNSGKVEFCGSVHEVFRRVEMLERVGLDVPQVTGILMELHKQGLPVRTDIYTVEACAKELARVVSQRGNGA